MKEIISEYGWILLTILVIGLIIGIGGATDGTLAGAAQDVVNNTITEITSLN